jgi:hypothetical protein
LPSIRIRFHLVLFDFDVAPELVDICLMFPLVFRDVGFESFDFGLCLHSEQRQGILIRFHLVLLDFEVVPELIDRPFMAILLFGGIGFQGIDFGLQLEVDQVGVQSGNP